MYFCSFIYSIIYNIFILLCHRVLVNLHAVSNPFAARNYKSSKKNCSLDERNLQKPFDDMTRNLSDSTVWIDNTKWCTEYYPFRALTTNQRANRPRPASLGDPIKDTVFPDNMSRTSMARMLQTPYYHTRPCSKMLDVINSFQCKRLISTLHSPHMKQFIC